MDIDLEEAGQILEVLQEEGMFIQDSTIQILAGHTLSDLLLDIAILMPVIYNLGKDKALLGIAQAIEDVSRL